MSTDSLRDVERDLFSSALETVSAAIAVLDAEGTLVMTTDERIESAREHGPPESSDATGIEYLAAIDGVEEADVARAVEGLDALLEGERDRFELEYPRRTGDDRRWVLMRAARFTYRGEKYVTVTHIDITERKRRDEALRDAYEISTADTASLTEQVEELLAVARTVIGTEYATFSRVEDDQCTVTAAADTGISSGDTVPIAASCKRVVDTRETLVVRDIEADAPELADRGIESYLGTPVTVDGDVYGTYCFYGTEPRAEAFSEWDVTFVELLGEWMRYELERRECEERLQHLRENITDVVWMSTPEKDEIEFVSDSYRDIWGRPPDTLKKQSDAFVEGIHPDDRDRVRQALADQQDSPDEYEETYRVVQPDGEVRWVHDRASGVFVDGKLQRIVGIATDITDRTERERELAYQTALLEAQAETTIDGLLVVDSDRRVRYHNDRFLDIWGIPEDSAVGQSDEVLLETVRDRLANPEAFRDGIDYLYDHPNEQGRDTVELTDGRWLDRYSAPVIGADGTHYGRLWALRDITEQKENEQALERQRDELLQLQRVNKLVRRTIQALQDTRTREEIETSVCAALTESNLYQTAWIGELGATSASGRTVQPQTAAGVGESYFEGIPDNRDGPAEIALQTGEVQVVDDLTAASAFYDERPEIALDHGNYALAAVPLRKEGTTYGVLVVYAPPDHTISETERDILADLGRSIALAIQRVHSQRSLTAETVVSLALRMPDTEFVFGRASAELGIDLSLERRVATSDGPTIYYLGVEGGDPTLVCERLRADPLIAACTVVRDEDDTRAALVEVRLSGESQLPLDVLTDYGATVTSARAVEGDIELRVELPSQVAVRSVLAAVREVAPTVELVSKQYVDRPAKTAAAMQDRVTAQLTDKQRAALEAAFARGYYTWPRESTMEEIAETFEISAPSLHYRLRRAHDTVVGSLLDPYQHDPDER